MTNALLQYTIYDHPRDYPYGYVVREWQITRAGPTPGEARHVPTLGEARKLVPAGCVRLPRAPDDDYTIVETWM